MFQEERPRELISPFRLDPFHLLKVYNSPSSRKYAYLILTRLNPTFLLQNWRFKGYTLFFVFLLKT